MFGAAVGGGDHERGDAAAIAGVDVGAFLDQRLSQWLLIVRARQHQGV